MQKEQFDNWWKCEDTDTNTTKSALQIPLLPDGILFEGLVLGRMMKFEDWDHADSKKFPHLETSKLMK